MPHTSTARADSAIVAMRREAAEAVRRSRAVRARHPQVFVRVGHETVPLHSEGAR